MSIFKKKIEVILITLVFFSTSWFLYVQYIREAISTYYVDDDRAIILTYLDSQSYTQYIRQEPGWYKDVSDTRYTCDADDDANLMGYVDTCNSMRFRIRKEDIPAVTKIILDEWGSISDYHAFKEFQKREINVRFYQGTYDPSYIEESREEQESGWMSVLVK